MGEHPHDKGEGTLCFLAKAGSPCKTLAKNCGGVGGNSSVFVCIHVYMCAYVYLQKIQKIFKVLDSLSLLTS